MTRALLERFGVDAVTRERVADILEARGGPDPAAEVAQVDDAEGLSFFSLESDRYLDRAGSDRARAKFAATIARMRPHARSRISASRLRADVATLVDAALVDAALAEAAAREHAVA
jgi:hypothetical protein